LFAAPALAHSPYLKPNTFTPDSKRSHVTVEAAFAEGDLRPDVAMKSDAFHAVAPDGQVVPLTAAANLKDATFLEVPLTADGTWLITSGVRQGRVAKAALKDGQIRFLEGGAALNPGETAVDVRSITRADVYVSRGTPAQRDVTTESGVEIHPVTAPYDAYAGEPFKLSVREGGKGLASAEISIIADGETYNGKSAPIELKTDASGQTSFTPSKAGLYLIQTRVRRASPDTPGLWLSNTATLTLEVLPQ
ncbi:MAG TPA: DUF4198 domain-containing protein, partial [Asticcacaulis sp.]|nr:DUF4198 domain-containing protein [Asticcacaulis sp.]